MKRYLEAQAIKDLNQKMVFVAGPRQVGKTTMAKNILGKDPGYLSWDIPATRDQILKREFPPSPLLVFDEIHKFRSWRNYLKGLYDEVKGRQKILVTGSARLDFYRFGGDSLQGRYHFLRLLPLSAAEIKLSSQEDLQHLLALGGFPEPFFGGNETEAKRWRKEYRSRVIHEDISSLEKIHDIGSLDLLSLRLPDLVGNPLSINSLREDLQTTHKTLSRWLDILERLYSIFRISPFGAPRIRAVKKERKHYHYDWAFVPEPGLRFENLVAVHLLKWVQFEGDTKGRDLELRYFRDVDGREVDFVITENRKPIRIIECKWGDAEINPALRYFLERFKGCDGWQISATGKKDILTPDNIRVCPAILFLKDLI